MAALPTPTPTPHAPLRRFVDDAVTFQRERRCLDALSPRLAPPATEAEVVVVVVDSHGHSLCAASRVGV